MAFVVDDRWRIAGPLCLESPSKETALLSSNAAASGVCLKRGGGFPWQSRARLVTPCRECRPRHPQISRIQSVPRGSSAEQASYGALLLDVGGTLLEAAEPVGEVYANFGRKYGVTRTADDIKKGFRKAFAEPWTGQIRYEGDGKPFWRFAVTTATGSSDEAYFDELYDHYSRAEAWKVAKGFREGLIKLRDAGVVSNFDLRLRPVLQELQLYSLIKLYIAEVHGKPRFDAIIVSAEVGFEKPSPEIFEAALKQLKVDPGQAVHVGDDATADKAGAKAVGIDAWLWKEDVKSFSEIVDRILDPSTRFV